MTSLTKQQNFSISWCPREKSQRLMSAHSSAQVAYATVKNFNTYVTLLRSWGWDTIRLLQDFQWEIITKHLSEELQEEDEWLEKLTSATKSKFEWGGFTYHWHQLTTCFDHAHWSTDTSTCTGPRLCEGHEEWTARFWTPWVVNVISLNSN